MTTTINSKIDDIIREALSFAIINDDYLSAEQIDDLAQQTRIKINKLKDNHD